MDAEKKNIKLKSNDGVVIELTRKAVERSGLLRGVIEDYPEDSEFPLNKINGKTLEKIKEYLTHYQDIEPTVIAKPLKSDKFDQCAEEWDYKFLDVDNDTLLALILGANFMDIKPLLELASAKVACLIRGTTTESIRKDFNITELNKQEEDQLNKDKLYLEQNL